MAQVPNVSLNTALTRSFLQHVPRGTVRQQDVVRYRNRAGTERPKERLGESYRVTSHMLCGPRSTSQSTSFRGICAVIGLTQHSEGLDELTERRQ